MYAKVINISNNSPMTKKNSSYSEGIEKKPNEWLTKSQTLHRHNLLIFNALYLPLQKVRFRVAKADLSRSES
ncbi:hypothetical protein HMPREF3226_00997 [Prevotella corporis]|uniref:Uncharacterized protein n=1 Tax=Prevotella corporis TaxID=28128 RepID=A0A133QCW9_9BACT|nr:hypothetical protein HMPREF3226_00997 [Prevotella corporis]